jgi:DNA-binding transcriptional regulator YiaG
MAESMTPQQFIDAIAELGLTQTAAARLLGVDARTARRWVAGDRDVPAPAVRFLRFLIAARIPAARVMKLLAEYENREVGG